MTVNNQKINKIALMFPGQGSQREKMGQQFLRFNSRYVRYFEAAGGMLGRDLVKIVNGEDPANSLEDTRYSQASIYCLSCALYDYLTKDLLMDISHIHTVMGHSLGEYSALYAAGAYGFEKGAELVVYRGAIMSQADRTAKGMMAAVLGMGPEAIEKVLEGFRGRVFIANYNDHTQTVISGYEDDTKKAIRALQDEGTGKIIPLKVNIASHCPLMEGVSVKLEAFIDENVDFSRLGLPFFSTTELRYVDETGLKDTLKGQLVNPIKWYGSIEYCLDKGVDTFIEIGPGKVLSGLVMRIARKNRIKVSVMNTDELKDIEELLGKLQEGGLLG